MDVKMVDQAKRPNTYESLAVRRLRRALAVLTASEQLAQHSTPTTYSVAQTFCSTKATPLQIYKAASHMREGQLREVVQFLIFSGPKVALVILRLLSVMQGLPGNWELTMEFLEQQTPQFFKSFPLRAFSFIAILGGRKAYTLCDWSSVIERAFKHDDNEARWALSTLSEYSWKGPTESVLRVFEWETELPYDIDPSIWREMQWAAYARTLCLSSDTDEVSASRSAGIAAEQVQTDFETLSSNFGAAASHYVRICGTLMRRRLAEKITERPTESRPRTNSNIKIARNHPVILTSTIRKVVCNMAAYLAYGIPFILEGPTGCGKTALISLLARKSSFEIAQSMQNEDAPGVTFIQMDGAMHYADGETFSSLIGCVVPIPEGGGFRWRPGLIGAAAERGDWIVFENVGRSTGRMSSAGAIIRQLATAKPGDKLEAPGRGEPIIIGRGFRCLATRTVPQQRQEDTWEPPGGWDTWHRMTMSELSFDEKVKILSERHVQIGDCIPRVVTVVEQVAKYTGNLKGPLFRTPTLREAVRICERLDSAKREAGSLSLENAFLETMDVLVAWCSSEQHFDELSQIASLCWSLSPQVGSNMYTKHRPGLSRTGQIIKVGRASVADSTLNRQSGVSRLSLTGHTLRLLERTLRCLELGENVLLSGETGSGKTASIQELASLVGKRLVVVNLSRQSELDDLIGGFRPIDTNAAVPLLAKRFEYAFCQCMSKQKNVGFLDALQKASRSLRHHHRALRLMEGAFKAIPKSSKQRSPSVWQEWEDIAASLEKLTISHNLENCSNWQLARKASPRRNRVSEEPLKKRPRISSPSAHSSNCLLLKDRKTSSPPRTRSRRIAFEFSDGILVQAMRNGDWILLDELNLAPPEVLERLVSVLETGQVALTDEQGDLVSKQDGFVLFGAMNPPTDTGKRPLPSVLRARFTEFHVGDMTLRDDLLDLIVHKFLMGSSSKEEGSRMSRSDNEIANDTADFYLNSYELAKQGRIEDSTGKPVRFSLRSLSRMLDFAFGLRHFLKTGSDGKRRALFEGALAAFGTQLPKKSRTQLNDMAEKLLLRKSRVHSCGAGRLVDLMSIPRNTGISTRMLHGFPVEVNCSSSDNIMNEQLKFIVTPTVEKTLTEVCRALVIGVPKLPILLQGPTAAGKTSLINYLAEQTGNKLIRINNHEHTEISEYIGGYVASEDGSLLFSEGPLIRAARNGDWVMLDELNLAPPDVLESLNRLLDDNREVFIPETAEVVKAASGFRLFATQNPPGLYGGRKELSRAFRSRFIEIQVDDLPDQELETILERRGDIPLSFARKMVAILRHLQMQRRTSGIFSGREGFITARDLFRWASRGPRCKEELAIHGFLLLGERARNMKERVLVRDVICKETGVAFKVLSDENLYAFDVGNDGSDASKECLDFSLKRLSLDRASISRALSDRNIILTHSMRRMLTLLIHCLANGEPALLVGATGGGKTTSCAAIAAALSQQLLTINCHRHTEASDILGGFRPVRRRTSASALFEWVDGPLVEAMKNGFWMLADEINMADDAVIERLNSVLELERTLLLSEKGTDKSSASPEVVVAKETFRILATMNPSGDFGKKELSPALRNRFTELWIPAPLCIDDYLPIIHQRLGHPPYPSEELKMASLLVRDIVEANLGSSRDDSEMRRDACSLEISVRDLTAWCDFILQAPNVCQIDPLLAAVHGSRLIFLDGMNVGLTSSHFKTLESEVWSQILGFLPTKCRKDAEKARYTEGVEITLDIHNFRIKVDNFYVPFNNNKKDKFQDENFSAFSFDAPNTVRNTARIARAICVGCRPVLLEGPPGSGKSSLIAAIASASGFKYSRVNLSEGTEMSDLVGSDTPGQDQGAFVFRRGPLLEALINGSWILLDELNLASQSVLEGLNSVLDHRKTLFVPELNTEFAAHASFRIFGAQNSATDGGGRRGLPKSFLNRFTRVHIESPSGADIQVIINSMHPQLSTKLTCKVIECLQDLCAMTGSNSFRKRFGLRDAIRWCDLLSGVGSRRRRRRSQPLSKAQLYTCFDVAILRSLRTCERREAESCFERIFGFTCDLLKTPPSLRPCEGRGFRIGFGTIEKLAELSERDSKSTRTLLEPSRCWELQAMSFAINARWPVAFFSPSSHTARFGAIRLVYQIATLFGKRVSLFDGASLTDAEDFVGGYVQHDAVASMHLIVNGWEKLLLEAMNMTGLENNRMGEGRNNMFAEIYKLLLELRHVLHASRAQQNSLSSLPAFLGVSHRLIDRFGSFATLQKGLESSLKVMREHHNDLKRIYEALLTGHFAPFKWRKSDLMKAVEAGEWIFMRDADACPPALLDRLNPIFERAAVAADEESCVERTVNCSSMILAEAPSNEDGSPVLLQPHPHFRMFFSLSKPVQDLGQCGLSKALLDRSLKLCIEEDLSDHDNAAFTRLTGLSMDQWVQCFDKDDEFRSSAVSAYLGVPDGQIRAERARFAVCVATGKNASMEITSLRKLEPPHYLHCASGFWHSVGDIPFTSVGTYVDNPILSSMERDIASLRLLEAAPDTTFLRFKDRGRQILESSSIAKETIFLELWSELPLKLEAGKQMLLGSGADAFLLGSLSWEDLAERAAILRKRATHVGSSASYTVYLNRSDATVQYMSSLQSLEGHDLVGFWSKPCSVPLDPLFALDQSSLYLTSLENETEHDSNVLKYCAKRLRAELLALHRFREAWARAVEGAPNNTFFARSKLTYMFRHKKVDAGDPDHGSFECLAFDVVSSAGSSIDAYCRLIRMNDMWEISNEDRWMSFFTHATRLCELMTIDREPTPSTLAATLFNIALALEGIEDRVHPYFDGLLDALHQRLQLFKTKLQNLLLLSKRGTIPTSRQGQDLENDIITSIVNGRRGGLSVAQIDAVVNGLATLTTQHYDREKVVLPELRKVVEYIGEKSSLSSAQTFTLDHWSRVVHHIGIRVAQDAITAIERRKLLHAPITLPQKDSLQVLHDCVSFMKCLPHLSMDSVSCMQKLLWIVESAATEQSQSSCLTSPPGDIGSLASLSLLRELNCLLSLQNILHDNKTSMCQQGVESLSSTLFLAQSHFTVPFWNLSQAYGEAVCAAALISRGKHRIDHISEASKIFLQICWKSVRNQRSVMKSGSFDSMGEETGGTQMFNRNTNVVSSLPISAERQQDSELEDDLAGTVQCAVLDAKNLSETDNILRFGKAWISVGLIHLNSYYRVIKRTDGIDPAKFSLSVTSLALEEMMYLSASCSAYNVFASHRLGGESFSGSVPAERLSRAEKVDTDIILKTSKSHIFRSPEKSTFEAYESFVDKVHAIVTRRIVETGLLDKLHTKHSPVEREQVVTETVLLAKSCTALSNDLSCEGTFGHFRDISTNLDIGLQAVQYGLHLFQKASEKCSVACSPRLKERSSFVSDIILFPRAAHKQSTRALQSIKLCMKLSVDANCVMALVNYLISSQSSWIDYCSDEISMILSEIVVEWKKRTLADEREVKRKESLHVLREAAREKVVPGGDVVDRLGMDEDGDFFKTFNPISPKEEEELCGVTLSQVPQPVAVSPGKYNNEMEEACGRRIGPNSFWCLHKKVFPPTEQAGGTAQYLTSRVQEVSSFASHLYSLTSEVLPTIDNMPSVWETFASHVISRKHAIAFSRTKNASDKDFSNSSHVVVYNFYTDANTTELVRASEALRSLRNAISRLQQSAFKETGNHPVLDEVDLAIQRITEVCKTNTPLSRVILGIENVLRKADEWQRLFATSNTRLDTDVMEVARIVARWRKLEVQSWPLLLQSRVTACEQQGYRWIFLLYDAVLHEGIQSTNADPNCIRDVISSVDQFLRSSPLGEFGTRLEMVRSIGRHVLVRGNKNGEYLETLGQSLAGLCEYYGLFLGGVRREIADMKRGIDKELWDFTQLTSWNASHDLGSSCKMFKGKDKTLEYYRLKSAAEKTRRKIHKLCLKMDAVVKAPVHKNLSRQLSSIGFFCSIGEEVDSQTKDADEMSFSVRIKSASQLLTESLVCDLTEEQRKAMSINPGEKGSLLSEVCTFEEKLKDFAKQFQNLGNMKCELAAEFSIKLRSAIQDRISKLRSASVTDIQVKKRALVELFKLLRATGISPFEPSNSSEPHQWLSVPNPSLCSKYNAVANELFWKSALQTQRLQEVSDSRLRHPDLANNDASKVRAFCQCLLNQACAQRVALREVHNDVQRLSKEVKALNRLKLDKETHSQIEEMINSSRNLSLVFVKLQEISVDLLASGEIFKQVVEQVQQARSMFHGSTNQAGFLIEVHSKESVEILNALESVLSLAVAAVKETVADQEMIPFEGPGGCEFAFIDNAYIKVFVEAKEKLLKLATVLNDQYSKAKDLAPDSFVTQLLTPVLSFVRDALKSHGPSVSADRGAEVLEFDRAWTQINEDADAMIKTVLVSSQRVLAWNDLNITSGGLRNINENAMLKEYTLQDLSQSGLMKTANTKVLSLASALNISQLLLILHRNADTIRRLLKNNVNFEQMGKILSLQRVLGRFLAWYLNIMIVPCLEKASYFHVQSLSLLRTLTSLFTGLCIEGFCRPPEHDNPSGETCEIDSRQGGGFGDAGEGDMSCAQNVSDQIEDEEQLLGLRDDLKSTNEGSKPQKDEDQDQDGVDMKTDFGGELQDLDDDEGTEAESDGGDKEMAPESGIGDNVIDERIWGDSSEAKPDNEDEEKDTDAKTSRSNEKPSELVAKKEEKTRSNEGRRDPDDQEHGPVHPPEEAQEDLESRMEEEKKEDMNKKDEQGKREIFANHKENPFDSKRDTDSNDEQEYEDDITEDVTKSSQDPSQRVDDSMLHDQEPLGDDADVDNDTDSDSTPDESYPVDQETENILPDGSGRDAVQEHAMVGVEKPKDTDEIDDDVEGPSMEISDVPELNLEDRTDSGNDSGEAGNYVNAEMSTDKSKDDIEMDVEHARMDNEKMDEKYDSIPKNENNILDQQQQNLSNQGQAMTGQPKNRNNTAGNEKIGKEDPKTAEQGENGDLNDHSDFVQNGENDVKSEVEGTDFRGLRPAVDKNMNGDVRQNMSSVPLDTNKDNSFGLNPNPLRVSSPEELAEIWKRRLNVLEEEGSRDAEQSSRQPNASDGLWQCQDAREENEGMYALGAATEDQHRHLNLEEGEENSAQDPVRDPHKREGDDTRKDPSSLPSAVVDEKTVQQDHGGEGNTAVPEGRTTEEDYQISLKSHPAHKAAEGVSESISLPAPQPLSLGEENSERLEVDGSDEPKIQDILSPQIKEITWQMETLDEETAKELWHRLNMKVSVGASTLCEQLRLILEPTVISGLSGGFRTGKRLNMRKLIEYVASDFQKDRIWLRRVKPDKRSYDVLVAIDDSASMAESEAGAMAIESLTLVLSALSRLEIGRVGVARFGAEAEMIRGFDEPLALSIEGGGKLLQQFSFSQRHTDVVKLLSFIQAKMAFNFGFGNVEHVSLAFVISDGRLSNREEVRRQLRHLKDANVLIAFIILDQALDERTSIYDVKHVDYDKDGNLTISPYMKDFPIDFYTTVQDIRSLPAVLGDALRQWVEAANA